MRIGGSVFLLAVGAILAFAVNDRLQDVDLTAVGYIVMAAGAIGLLWSAYLTSRTQRTVVRDTAVPVRGERTVIRDAAPLPGERTVVTRDVY